MIDIATAHLMCIGLDLGSRGPLRGCLGVPVAFGGVTRTSIITGDNRCDIPDGRRLGLGVVGANGRVPQGGYGI